jgi:hypothetical protein
MLQLALHQLFSSVSTSQTSREAYLKGNPYAIQNGVFPFVVLAVRQNITKELWHVR